jgi:superfamily II DNA or RNA helicase
MENTKIMEITKINTYLGQKGYTIPKNEISIEKQKQLRNDLTIKPVSHGAPPGGNSQVSFPAYRESSNKFYVPHYYGVTNFGAPKEYKISEGINIDLEFAGKLRENQEIVVDTYFNHVKKVGYGGGLLELPCAYGKCLGIDTEILMYDGTIKKVQDIQVGDVLMGDDSTPRNVLTLARGREQMYKISNKKGDTYVCNESHILSLKSSSNHSKLIKKGNIIDISVKDFLNLPKCFHGKGGVLLGYKVPINFEEKNVEFDPYLLGYWLGDGTSRNTNISTEESYVIKYMVDLFKNKHTDLYLKYTGSQYDYRINSIKNTNSFKDFLRKYNLLNNKHIPYHYLCNSKDVRLKLLAGIIDSDGYFNKNCIEIVQKNEKLLDNIIYLARSLGFACYKKRVIKTCTNSKEGPKQGVYFLSNIYGKGIEEIPTLCPRKKGYVRKQIKDALTYRLQIDKLEIDEYYGFEIDGNRRFVLADFTVTHNTVLSLNIISRLKKKTFIIVHKEFLMNQWIERIQQFLPKARIGKIQGQIIDIDDKDIVIGMLQSLSMKEYPASVFESFGLTIIDEVHHISSEVFSNSLFKLVTKYMLGLSATMNRKDGTTHVFKMFLGDVIFKGKRDEEREVIVRAIEYHVDDDEFNEVKLDYRGNVAYSTMISKLCEYNRRSEFILKVLSDMLQENPAQQIMVLAHNKNILKYLHDAIQHRNIATVGYYIGGMKEQALKETEGRKVVIATYAMAAEALDIKTLTTLIMATPKTDIEQSVGRILREKHSNPIVVDIVDSHDTFKNQWRKRKTFYKKENYKIIYTTSPKYNPDTSGWTVVFNPKSSGPKECTKKTPKNISVKSNSSSDKSIANDSDDEVEEEPEKPKDKYLAGVCFLKMKK